MPSLSIYPDNDIETYRDVLYISVRHRRNQKGDEEAMAITKIHAIKATVSGAVNYICDAKKTDSQVLITSYPKSRVIHTQNDHAGSIPSLVR